MIKKIIQVLVYIVFISLVCYDAYKCSYMYLFPLFFEMSLLVLSRVKKDGYKFFMSHDKFSIIKNAIFLITLIIGLISVSYNISSIILKITLTITIFSEILLYLKYDWQK